MTDNTHVRRRNEHGLRNCDGRLISRFRTHTCVYSDENSIFSIPCLSEFTSGDEDDKARDELALARGAYNGLLAPGFATKLANALANDFVPGYPKYDSQGRRCSYYTDPEFFKQRDLNDLLAKKMYGFFPADLKRRRGGSHETKTISAFRGEPGIIPPPPPFDAAVFDAICNEPDGAKIAPVDELPSAEIVPSTHEIALRAAAAAVKKATDTRTNVVRAGLASEYKFAASLLPPKDERSKIVLKNWKRANKLNHKAQRQARRAMR